MTLYELPKAIKSMSEAVLAGKHKPLWRSTTDVQTDVHIVPVDCGGALRNLLILPTPIGALRLARNFVLHQHHSPHHIMC